MSETDELYENAVFIWDDVTELAKGYTADPSIQAWVGRLKPVSFDGVTFVVAAKLRWTERTIMTKYRSALERFLYEITLEHVQLSVVVDPTKFGDENPVSPTSTTPATSTVSSEASSVAPISVPIVAPALTPKPIPEPIPASQPVVESKEALNREPLEQESQLLQPMANPKILSEPTLTNSVPDVTEEGAAITLSGNEGVPTDQGQQDTTPLVSFTFDTFVVGEANRMAFEVARTVAEGGKLPGNPVFIYSKSGLGKTHLLLSILNYIRTNRPDVDVVYATANGFVEDYVDEMQNRRVRGKDVMRRYRDCGVLLIDDVQFFVKKQESVTTFFDIFNQLTMAGKTIVLSADEPPDYLQLDDRIKTRFSMGTVLDIAQPSYELKRNILDSLYTRRVSWLQGDLSSEQLDWIAEYSPNNIREMQGFLNRVMLRASQGSSTASTNISEDQIKAIRDEIFRTERKVEIPAIIRFVAKEYGVSESDVRGQRRTKMVSEARQVSMWLARQMTDDSYQSIGNYFSRDHSTVYNSIMKIDKLSRDDRSFMNTLEGYERSIKNR